MAPTTPNKTGRVRLSDGSVFGYQLPWDGRTRLQGTAASPLAFDTETELIRRDDPTHVPSLALATASDGRRSVILRPDQLGHFIVAHSGEHWVGQNVAFDFWVVHEHLKAESTPGSDFASLAWWKIADDGRLHDTILLDMLIRLARAVGTESASDDGGFSRRNLDEIARDYAGLRVDKDDPFRLRYGELIGKDWADVKEQGFWTYAIQDSIVTQLAYRKMAGVARRLFDTARERAPRDVYSDAARKYGPLTETLQVRASLALRYMERTGIKVDAVKALDVEDRLRDQLREQIAIMWEAEPDVFKYKELSKKQHGPPYRRPHTIVLTPKGGTPSMKNDVLTSVLVQTAKEHRLPLPISGGKLGGVSRSAKAWHPHRKKTPFLAAWCETTKLAKMIGFFANFRDRCILHPKYNVLMRTGRTSCYSPNLQQMPRDAELRSLFIARSGHKLLTIDYSYIELRTLAAVCEHRYGWSRLADTIREGVDPHVYTAAMIRGVSVEEFQTWKEERSVDYKADRQAAKACFHPDVEILTRRGWKKVSDINTNDEVAQHWPGSERVDYSKPLALTYRDDQSLVRVHNEGIDIRVTPDHRMLGYRQSGHPTVCYPADMNRLFRGIWNAGIVMEGLRLGDLNTKDVRRCVAIQADGSYQRDQVRFGFKKQRKIDRFLSLFPEAFDRTTELCAARSVRTFAVPNHRVYSLILDERKVFRVENLLRLPYGYRRCFMDELAYWDSHKATTGRFSYCTTIKENADAVQAVAAVTGYKTSCKVVRSANPNRKDAYVVSVKQRSYTRGGTFEVDELPGRQRVYCLSMPSSFVIARDGGKPVIIGQCNFGVPGGLGPVKLAAYARASYGVEMSVDEAAILRNKLIREVYPELDLYLGDTTLQSLAHNFGVTEAVVKRAFGLDSEEEEDWVSRMLRAVGKVVRGKPQKADGTPYKERFVDRIWFGLRDLSGRSRLPLALKQQIKDRQASPALERALCCGAALTLTGRVRGSATYTQSRNTPFQGLAADGGKMAMWDLLVAGYAPVAFVHDELLVELPEATAEQDAKRCEEIIVRGMEKVLDFKLPIACEGHVGDHWQKG